MGDTQNNEVRYHFDARAFGTDGVAIICSSGLGARHC